MNTLNNDRAYGLNCLKRGLLLFWSLWFTVAFLTNTFDFLRVFDMLPPEWRFRSGNYSLVSSVISLYQLGTGWANFLFSCVLLIEGLIAILFYQATFTYGAGMRAINRAFGVSIGLWATFTLVDELFIAYNYEGTHTGLLGLELLTLLAIHLLPSD